MKRLITILVIAVSFVLISNKANSQNEEEELDQFKLMEQFLGTWQVNHKDFQTTLEYERFGKTFVANEYRDIEGNKTRMGKYSYGFLEKEGKFRVFVLLSNGYYFTWTGSFISQNKWVHEFVFDFNPDPVYSRVEIVFTDPNSQSIILFNSDGTIEFETNATKMNSNTEL